MVSWYRSVSSAEDHGKSVEAAPPCPPQHDSNLKPTRLALAHPSPDTRAMTQTAPAGLRKRIRRELQVLPQIDPATEVERRVAFLTDYLRSTPARGLVLGISGGQDSTLAGRLCQLAAERLRKAGHEATFTAVRLPYGTQSDEADAQLALDFIRPDRCLTVNIQAAADASAEAAHAATGERLRDFVRGNIKARERMVAQYALAGQDGLLVVGTDHAAEAITGFYTKYGDGGADVTL